MFAPFIVPSGIIAHLCGGSIIDEIHLCQLPSGFLCWVCSHTLHAIYHLCLPLGLYRRKPDPAHCRTI